MVLHFVVESTIPLPENNRNESNPNKNILIVHLRRPNQFWAGYKSVFWN